MNLRNANNTKKPGLLCLLCFLILSLYSQAFAAPHIIKGKNEPREHPGKTLQERFAPRVNGGRMYMSIAPSSQNVNILFLRVEFQQDEDPSTTGNGRWNDPVYAQGEPANANDPGDPAFNYWVNRAQTKFKEYWNEVSCDMLNVQIVVSPKIYRLSHVMSYYGNESNGALENLVYDSLSAAMADNVNFGLYDVVLVVHAGSGEEADRNGNSPGDIWSLYYENPLRDQDGAITGCISQDAKNINCLNVRLADGELIHEVIIMPQTGSQDAIVVDPLGVYLHEFGHWLGLPDLYCTDLSCSLDGVGKWSLMGDGIYNQNRSDCPPGVFQCYGSSPAHLDAWSKIELGWATPRIIATDESVILDPVESAQSGAGPSIIRAQASSGAPGQYFLIENRQQSGFDKGLPGHGLLVWLIDDEVVKNNLLSNAVNNNADHPGIKLIEADGDNKLLSEGCTFPDDCGSSGDPFPGSSENILLTPMTKPSSRPFTDFGMVNIGDIEEQFPVASGVVTFTIGFAPLPPGNLMLDRNSKTLAWTASDGATFYNIYKNAMPTPYVSIGQQTAYRDDAYQAFDVYRITALDGNGNESQSANIAPLVIADPGRLSFSDTVTSGTITLANRGNSDLLLRSITLSGKNAADFISSNDCTSVLGPGGSCFVTVRFITGSKDSKIAALSVASNDPVNPSLEIPLTGTSASAAAAIGGGGDGAGTGSGSKACFIATAAYGSYLEPHVLTLRRFRDRYLLTNAAGRALVSFYYRHSPPVAGFIRGHESLKAATRWFLTPIVFLVEYPRFALILFLAGAVMASEFMRRRRALENRGSVLGTDT